MRGRAVVIAVNDAYTVATWADHLYACDPAWWNIHAQRVRETFTGLCWTQDKDSAERFGLIYIEGVPHVGLGETRLHTGNNSGYQALNLAWLLGANEAILYAFDMAYSDKRKLHFFGNHPPTCHHESPYGQFIKAFETIEPAHYGLRIVNATRGGALECFPRQSLEELFP